MYEIHIFVFFSVHLTAALLGSILGSHLDTILQARVVIGTIAGARGAPECLKAGGSCERLFQGGLRNKDWGGGPSRLG